jgi:hypothetical protein
MARATAAKPSLLLIATKALPSRCPGCGWKALRKEAREGGWYRVTCERSDKAVCQWAANYEVKA